MSSGFLARTTIDFDSPDFAAARWHLENADAKEGIVKLHFYRGRPRCSASISQQLSGFVAYSPAWTYNWAIAATYCRDALWFVRHNESEARLYRFQPVGDEGSLQSYPIPGNPTFLQKLDCRPEGILVNDSILIPFSTMQQDESGF